MQEGLLALLQSADESNTVPVIFAFASTTGYFRATLRLAEQLKTASPQRSALLIHSIIIAS
jgi:hypothetical protein